MRKIIGFVGLGGIFLTSCGGGQVSEVIHAATVSTDILKRCLALPTSLDEVLLGCLSGKISLGRDSSGNECSVSFSSDRLNIVSKTFTQDVLYQRVTNSGSKSTTFLYERSYSAATGYLNFSVTASNAGVPYFGFSFSGNVNSGNGTAVFGFELTPELPAPPGVVLQCTMQI
jgi:hypothetical protein